ncbi:hypothetical protein H310_03144 [Aphanomyces invadans]|uniref:Uncharacterized protein n=1 Tax=Aphanomyces invadans TaxID=157072 RepID=A0A024UMJ0_9STRA|nr:hypothetical protein H310_03144 [Aphanomyces invadans]ETW07072.1 hypothetical protein H310_03144 [Aphanomyces invadans]|eukprot:XP_008865147.1 hypothetical protein H310_03144 [Aphanomyces invadans]
MVAVASNALAKCLTTTYIVSRFEKAGDKPGVMAMTIVQATVRVESRVVVHLRELGIDIDSARDLCINDAVVQRLLIEPVPQKEAKKKEEEMIKQKKKASAQKRVVAAKTKMALDERRREASERKSMSLEDSSKPESGYSNK